MGVLEEWSLRISKGLMQRAKGQKFGLSSDWGAKERL